MAEFKTLNGYAVKDKQARDELDRRLYHPSGDTSGSTDRYNIESRLLLDGVCYLSKGEFYLDKPVEVKTGDTIQGAGVTNTIIHAPTGLVAPHRIQRKSVDHITIRDLKAEGSAGYTGIDITQDPDVETETGGRYSTFANIHLYGYSTCVRMSRAWCVSFDKCRLEAVQQCVQQEGSCNNVNYTNCMFLGVEDQTTGVVITAEGGAQNCGVTFNNCDFERHVEAIHATTCVGLTIKDIYCEGVQRVFTIDTCPGFRMAGGYVTFPGDKLGNVLKSNDLPAYDNCTMTIDGVHVRLNKGEDTPLLTLNKNVDLDMRNMSVVNDGGGKVYATHLDSQTIYDYGGNGGVVKVKTNSAASSNWQSDPVLSSLPPLNTKRERYKLIKAELVMDTAATLTSGTNAAYVRINGTVAWSFYWQNNTAYTSGQRINMGAANDVLLGNFIDADTVLVCGGKTNNADVKWHYELTFARGEFVLYE